MNKVDVIAAIKQHEPEFRHHGVTHVYLFGSVARNEAKIDSDVDLFFDHGIKNFGIIEYIGLKQLADELFPYKVDFIDRASLHPKLRANIENSAEIVF